VSLIVATFRLFIFGGCEPLSKKIDFAKPQDSDLQVGRGRMRQKIASIARLPIIGPIVLGLAVGLAIAIAFLAFASNGIESPNTLGATVLLTPFALVISTVSASLGDNKRWHHMLGRAFLASFSAFVLLPSFIYRPLVWLDLRAPSSATLPMSAILAELEFLKSAHLPFSLALFANWTAFFITAPSWLIAMAITAFRRLLART
jgi:hypothetical protein